MNLHKMELTLSCLDTQINPWPRAKNIADAIKTSKVKCILHQRLKWEKQKVK